MPVQLRPRVKDGRIWLIDSHCHLDMVLERGVHSEEILNNMAEQGVGAIIQIGAARNEMLWARQFAHAATAVQAFYTIGHHPAEATNGDWQFGLDFIQENAGDARFVAVGEIGLDYHYHAQTKEIQKKVFVAFLQEARQAKRPVVIHTRDAHDDTVRILRTEGAGIPTLIHCFSGSRAEMEEFLELGCYISFSGIVTFKNANAVQEAAKFCPQERLLVETDAPYLAPVPMRGKTNQPGFVRYTLEFLAALRGENSEELAAACVANTQRFFSLESGS
ncbi:MAG: TatD family hydrolase [Turneriella sp.]|nr:TatD family hydrolase [Turneriella sp.]